MMNQDEYGDDEEMNATHKTSNTVLRTERNDLPDIPLCGCFSVRFYQPYFDIDTVDVISRISNAMFYCKREENFMSRVRDKPDAYGPFWIATTLVFTLAATSHINSWLSSWMSGKDWVYDFESIVTASTLVFGFAVGAPLGIWFVLKQLSPSLRAVTIGCLYGYSLFVFIPATLMCLYPSELVSWLALTGAAATSTVFLLRNLAPIIMTHAAQQSSFYLGAIAIIQVALSLIVKLSFYYNK